MRTKLIGLLVCVIAVLGGANVVQRILDKLDPEPGVEATVAVPAAFQSGDAVIAEKFAVEYGGTLEVSVAHADVEVRTRDASEARVEVLLEGNDMDRARAYFDAQNFTVQKDGDRIIVKSTPDRGSWNWRSSGRAKITVVATVPTRFDGNLATSHGDLAISSLEGKLHAATSHGDIAVSDVAGPEVQISTSHGDVAAGSLQADQVAVRTSHGDIAVGSVTAARTEVQVSH